MFLWIMPSLKIGSIDFTVLCLAYFNRKGFNSLFKIILWNCEYEYEYESFMAINSIYDALNINPKD